MHPEGIAKTEQTGPSPVLRVLNMRNISHLLLICALKLFKEIEGKKKVKTKEFFQKCMSSAQWATSLQVRLSVCLTSNLPNSEYLGSPGFQTE